MIMKRYLFIFIIAMIAITGVSAYSSTYTAPDDKALEIITFTSNGDTTANYILTQANGDTISGSWSYQTTPFTIIPMQADGTIGSGSGSFTSYLPGTLTTTIWSTGNVSGTMKARMGMGQFPGIYTKTIETDMSGSPIIGYSVSADQDITEDQVLVPRKAAEKAMTPTSGEGYAEKLIRYADLLWGLFSSLFYWLKFLFVDHIVLTVSLYFTGTMAYAITTSRNIFAFYKTWFRQQRAFFDFIASVFSILVGIITQIINALKPI